MTTPHGPQHGNGSQVNWVPFGGPVGGTPKVAGPAVGVVVGAFLSALGLLLPWAGFSLSFRLTGQNFLEPSGMITFVVAVALITIGALLSTGTGARARLLPLAVAGLAGGGILTLIGLINFVTIGGSLDDLPPEIRGYVGELSFGPGLFVLTAAGLIVMLSAGAVLIGERRRTARPIGG